MTEAVADPFESLTAENVEEELKRLKLVDETYISDDEEVWAKDRVRLTGQGIDINLLRAGQDVEAEFEVKADNDTGNYDWSDEIDEETRKRRAQKQRESLYAYRNLDTIMPQSSSDKNNNNKNNNGDDNEEDDDDEGEDAGKTPFEVLRGKMTDVSDEGDAGVLKRVLVPGTGHVAPIGARVRIHYNAYFELDDEPFDSTYMRSRSQEFRLGDGSVVLGLDIAVSTMRRAEKAQFIFEPKYFMGERGCPPRVPGDQPVLFEIELISFIEANEYEDYVNSPEEQRKRMTLPSMLKICNCLRELGNDNYQRKNYKEASKKYRKAIYLLDHTLVSNDEEDAKWEAVMVKLYLNMSQVALKQFKPKKTIYFCKLVLGFDADNVKALFRYGVALRMLKDFDGAKNYLQRAYKLKPGCKEIIEELDILNVELAKWKLLERDLYRKMLDFCKKPKLAAIEAAPRKNFKLEPNDPNFKTKEQLAQILNDFVKNDKMRVYKMPCDLYSNDVVEFACNHAESLNLQVRRIQGENNVLQIMKSF